MYNSSEMQAKLVRILKRKVRERRVNGERMETEWFNFQFFVENREKGEQIVSDLTITCNS